MKKYKKTSIIINTSFTSPTAGSRTITLYKVYNLVNIWLTTSVTTITGVHTITFNTVSTTNNPYISIGSSYSLRQISINSYLAGVNNFHFENPISIDTITIAYPTYTGAVNIMFELIDL